MKLRLRDNVMEGDRMYSTGETVDIQDENRAKFLIANNQADDANKPERPVEPRPPEIGRQQLGAFPEDDGRRITHDPQADNDFRGPNKDARKDEFDRAGRPFKQGAGARPDKGHDPRHRPNDEDPNKNTELDPNEDNANEDPRGIHPKDGDPRSSDPKNTTGKDAKHNPAPVGSRK